MDLRIKDGDIFVNSAGKTEYISGPAEAVQRTALVASAAKGAFIYDRGFGTDFGGLSPDDAMLKEKLDMRVREAVADIADTDARVLSVDRDPLIAALSVTCGSTTTVTEVELDGNL